MPNERRMIRRSQNVVYDIDGLRLSELITFCQKFMTDNGDHIVDVCGSEMEVNFHIERMETQDEADYRVESDERYRRVLVERERREYDRLKNKFESKD